MDDQRKLQTIDDLIDPCKDVSPDFYPGEKFGYSNQGYRLLGKIIEIVRGVTYEEYLRQNIFEPLGMRHSGLDNDQRIIKSRASGYNYDGGSLTNARYSDMLMFAPYAAGGIYSSVEDLYLWDQVLYTERLLKKESIDKMFLPYSDEDHGY